MPVQDASYTQIWLLVSKGHMTLLRRPEDAVNPPVVREVVAAGWEVHLEAVQGPEARVRARDLPSAQDVRNLMPKSWIVVPFLGNYYDWFLAGRSRSTS